MNSRSPALLAMIQLFLLTILAVCPYGLSSVGEQSFLLAEDIHISVQNGNMLMSFGNIENGLGLKGKFGLFFPEQFKNPQVCVNDPSHCLQFSPTFNLTAIKVGNCYDILWTIPINLTIDNCLDYGDAHWYGGPQNYQQYWPFNNMTFKDTPYIIKNDMNQVVAEPYWVSSTGYYIYVFKDTPLFLDSNHYYKNSICLIARQAPPYLPRDNTILSYTICKYDNVKIAHMKAIDNRLGKPYDVPDQRMVQHPIWSTWVRFKSNVNDTAIRTFAKEIISNGFNNSQLEINDNWETCYGSAQFNISRFPNMPKLAVDLKKMGFRVTLWNHPFINTNCELFSVAKKKEYLVKDQNGNVVSTWWDGEAGVVDFTNPIAAQWFMDRRRYLMAYNIIDNLKMDAGESSWLPQIPQLNATLDEQPNAFTNAYLNTVSTLGSMVEVRVASASQNLPIFIRMQDKDSKWTFQNGLPTLLTTLLQLNLNGYTFVLPDMVGGNAYGGDVITKEMFIRWLQANTFMPSIQFSVAPWDFDEETVEISKKFTALHYAYSDTIYNLMKENVKTGAPVNMPIWWIAPDDPVAHTIWSEYVLGEDIVVAPVVEKGAVQRDIYLPEGTWLDQNQPGKIKYKGPHWIYNYSAPLDMLPYFTRVMEKSTHQEL